MKVMLAEDDPVLTRKLEVFMRRWGYDLSCFLDGREAVRSMEEWTSPGIAILDWEMPVMSGIEVCRSMREDPHLKNSYIIMLTARGKKEDMKKGFEAGVDDYISKPFDPDELRLRIRVGERIIRLENELMKRALTAERRYLDLFESSIGGTIQLEVLLDDGRIASGRSIAANRKMCSLLGFSKEELLSRDLTELVHGSDLPKIADTLKTPVENENGAPLFEARFLKKDGGILWGLVSLSELVGTGEDKRTLILSVEDISERKFSHMELMKKILKYRVEEGNVYLACEKVSSSSVEALKDLLRIGYAALIVSRRPEKDLRKIADCRFRSLWLSEKETPDSIDPLPETIGEKISTLPQKEVVFIDNLEYLISRSSFEEVLHMVQALKDEMVLKDSITIIRCDPTVLSERELAYLMTECEDLEPFIKKNMSKDLFEILRLVREKEIRHRDATFEDIEEELGISRPTARNRVKELQYFDYLHEIQKGKRKIFKLSEKGSKALM